MATRIQALGLTEQEFRGARFAVAPRRPGRVQRSALPHPARRRAPHPRRVPGGGRRRPHHQHLQRHSRIAGGLRARRPGGRDQRGGGPGGAAGGRRRHLQGPFPASLRGRVDRPHAHHPLPLPRRGGSRLPVPRLRRDRRGLPPPDRGPRGRGCRRAAGRDRLRHPHPEGLPPRTPGLLRVGRPAPAPDDLGDGSRTAAAAPCPARPSRPSGTRWSRRPGLLSIGVNCSLGPADMRAYVEDLARLAPGVRHLPSERRAAERARPLRGDPGRGLLRPRPVRAGGSAQHGRWLLRNDAEAHPGPGRIGVGGGPRGSRLQPWTSPATAVWNRWWFTGTRASSWSANGPTSPALAASRACSARATTKGPWRWRGSRSRAAPTSSTSTWTRGCSTRRP